MNISLTPELERRIAEKVGSGLYSTASEVVREALRRLFDLESERERLRAKLQAEIDEGIAELDRGEGLDGDAVFAEMDALIASKRRK
ncbi:MAG TPA: type II toxin-antitoxin system ParD family antitoxin [Caulobacteraceae bacterium]|jgi:antitoxin ParD1/3/4